jgi:hypothetical protein
MSVVGSDDIKDGDCKRGRVTQQPPISYTQFKYPKWITEPDSVKVRLPKGDQYTCDLMNDANNAETYFVDLMTPHHLSGGQPCACSFRGHR